MQLELSLPELCPRPVPLLDPNTRLSGDGIDWEATVSDSIRQKHPQAELLRWAVTTVRQDCRIVLVEAIATLPAA